VAASRGGGPVVRAGLTLAGRWRTSEIGACETVRYVLYCVVEDTMTETSDRERLALMPSRGTADIWRAAAERMGYIVPVGTYAGQGSISQLMSAIAAGRVDMARLEREIATVRMVQADLGLEDSDS